MRNMPSERRSRVQRTNRTSCSKNRISKNSFKNFLTGQSDAFKVSYCECPEIENSFNIWSSNTLRLEPVKAVQSRSDDCNVIMFEPITETNRLSTSFHILENRESILHYTDAHDFTDVACTESDQVIVTDTFIESLKEGPTVGSVTNPIIQNLSETTNATDFERSIHSAQSMKTDLSIIALKRKVPKCIMTDFLQFLNTYYPSCGLPHDSKSLLGTSRKADIRAMSSGKYTYFGLSSGIEDFLKHKNSRENTDLQIEVALDGLPIANLGGSQFWPLMGRVTSSSTVFLIACYWGKSKPSSANDYLSDFVTEITSLILNGFMFSNVKYRISLFILRHSRQ